MLSNVRCINEHAILVYVRNDKNDGDWEFQEFLSLVSSVQIKVLHILISKCIKFNAKYFIGTGKVLELVDILKKISVSIVLFSCVLSSRQERNLHVLLKCRIIDRNQLILNIFASRARTYEGKLQVQLAQLRYLHSRLIHEWDHLERQTGGIGVRSGPGEMQLESDRRVLRRKILQILLRLKKIENQRDQNRKRRKKIGIPIISLVGYTNVGKSTLFNLMTKSNVYTEKKLFSTLDPTFRRITYCKQSNLLLVDTVGFIQNLPKSLLTSFKATLKEIIESAIILHVVDVSNKEFKKSIEIVRGVLQHINVNDFPTLLVMNKIDQLAEASPHIDRDNNGYPIRVWISAKDDIGISLLLQALNELLSYNMIRCELTIPVSDILYQKLYSLGIVEEYQLDAQSNIKLKIRVSTKYWFYLLKQYSLLSTYITAYV